MGIATCKTSGLCDGMGGCALYPSGAVCHSATCNSRTIQVRRCDGQGACKDANVDCDPWRCDPTTTACYTSCTDDTQCATTRGRTCQMGVCM
jgi:hypothetical protein